MPEKKVKRSDSSAGQPAIKKKPKGKPPVRGGRGNTLVNRGVREFSAGFILFREVPLEDGRHERVYLLLDYGKHWDYAKGHLEEGETAWQAAVRELREETGIKQVDRVGRFEKSMDYVFFSPKKGRVHKTVFYFLGRTRADSIAISDEHTGFAWLPFDEAMAKLTYDNAREILQAAHDSSPP